jgi:hypothetical protein
MPPCRRHVSDNEGFSFSKRFRLRRDFVREDASLPMPTPAAPAAASPQPRRPRGSDADARGRRTPPSWPEAMRAFGGLPGPCFLRFRNGAPWRPCYGHESLRDRSYVTENPLRGRGPIAAVTSKWNVSTFIFAGYVTVMFGVYPASKPGRFEQTHSGRDTCITIQATRPTS